MSAARPRLQRAALHGILHLRLYGTAQVQSAQGRVLPLHGRAAALVALAALEPGIGRQRAAALLWPEAVNARQNLRQQLLRFRQALGQPLVVGEDLLHLADAVRLEPATSGAELLAGEPEDHDAFGLWLRARRHTLAQAQQLPLRQALAAAEAAADLDTALQHAQALLALDAEEEAHHTTLMRLYFLRGEAAAGLAAWRRLQDLLHKRSAASPGAAAQALAAALHRLGQAPLAASALALPLPVALKRPPLLAGRRDELDAATTALGEGLAVLFEAEAGMGKSRLLQECLASQPKPALQAAGRPGDSGAPYSTLARLLRPLLVEAAVLSPSARVAMARIGALNAETPDVGPLSAGAVEAAVAELVEAAAVRCVVLDDLHFADAATLELVSGLVAQETRCRFLFAQRPAEAPAGATALRQALAELRRLVVVPLAPLDTPACAQLLQALDLPGLDSATLAPLLVRHSGGNPLFLLETLKQGLHDGSLARGVLPRPGNVGALIEQRLQRLSEPALTLARVAAIAGVDFCIELAEAAIGQSAVQLASAWRELQDAQVLRDEALAHDLVADATLRGVPPVVARRVHAQCAAWLAGHGGEPVRLAHHWRAGGQPLAAAAAFEQAARRAREAARQTEEADLYAEAASAYADGGQPAARFEALANRVSALVGARSDDAALAEARALPAEAGNDLQRVRALRVLADQLGQRGPFEAAIQTGEQGLALARSIGAQDELVRLTSVTAGNQIKVGRTAEAYSLMLPLREWVDREADDELRHIWYGYWAAVLGHMGRLREGVAGFDVAIACAERIGALPQLSMALANQSVVLRTLGALPRAHAVSARALTLLAQDPDSAQHRLARLMHARNEAETGRLGDAQRTLDELLPHFETMGAAFWVHAVRATQSRLWQHLGQHARALQALQLDDAGVPAWMQAGRLWLRLEVDQWLGLPLAQAPCDKALALLDGDTHRRTGNAVRGLRFATPQAVLDQARSLADGARQQELFGSLGALQMHRARAALAMGQVDVAATAARELLTLLDEGYVPDFVYTPEAWLVAGQALQRAGEAAQAQAALAAGQHWVRSVALPQVPAPFIDSFLQRNPVNRALLTGA
jgi:DNA-binding SARP family transcriptional activator